MRLATGMRGSLVAAAFLISTLAGIAGAASPAPPRYERALDAPVDPKGIAPLPGKTGPGSPRITRAATLTAATSNQYPGEIEPNDTPATATPLGGPSSAREGNIFGAGDVDYWSFTAAAGDRVYAATMTSLSSNASVDSVLDLIDSDGTTVIETDADDGSFGATSSSIAGATLPAAGTYYLRVRHASAATQLRPYRLFFQLRSGTPTAEAEPNDTFPGQAMPAGNWVSGNTSSAADPDFYALNLNAGDTVFVSVDLDPERDTVEWNAQVGLGAFGTPPLVLVVNDAGAATPDSEAFFLSVKDAGTYGVFVGTPTGGTTFGTYHLSVTVFPQAVEGANCTTYTSTNVPVTIPGGPGIVTSTVTIPGNPRIEDLDVAVNITHNFMADLDVQLTAPGGNMVGLFSDIGSVTVGAQTTMDAIFDDEGAVPSLFTVTQGLRLAPELNYRLSWFDGQDAGGTWTLTLRDDATGDGGSLNNWSLRVCEPPPPPDCAPGFVQTTVLSTDFESGAAGFTHSGTADEWELGLPTFAPIADCASGSNCWKTDLDGTYEANATQELLSPNIDLTGLSPPIVVRWAQKYQVESAQFDGFSVDLRQVGAPTNAVRLFQHLGADMVDNVGNPVVTIQEASGWGHRVERADALAGQNVEFAVNHYSDATVQRAGVAIDDVSVSACRAASADLSITKTDGVTDATPGGSVTYTITASNAGTDNATGATVADTFPAALTCTWTCVGAGGGTCTASGSGNINDTVNLPAGGSTTYTASCTVSAAASGTLVNTATVSSSIADPNPANNSATDTDTLTASADLAITKTDGVTTATPGGSVTYTITSSNAGPSNAVGATVADTFPAALTCTWTCVGAGGGTCTASGSGNLSDTVNLPAGGSTTHTASCTVSAAASGTLSNTATVSSAAADPSPANNSATDTDTLAPSADLAITKTDGVAGVTAGGSTTYTITASNAGPSNATGATVADTFPAALTCTWTCAGAGGGTCTASGSGNINDTANLPAGGSATYTATCSIALAASGTLSNTATVSAPGGVTDPTPANNSATDSDTIGAAGANLSASKSVTGTFTPGTAVVYTVVVGNSGGAQADNPGDEFTDVLPAGLVLVSATATSGSAVANVGTNTVTWNGALPIGGSATITINATIAATASGTLSNQGLVSYDSDGNGSNDASRPSDDPALGGASDPTSFVVGGAVVDLSITKTDGVSAATAGGSTTYTIVAANAGPSAVTGATVADALPASLTCTWTCSGAGGGSCGASGTGAIGDAVNLPPGGSATYTAICSISASASGTLVNTATITAPSGANDTNPANNSATDTDTLIVPGRISATKTVTGSFQPGGSVTYAIVLTNAGGAQADNPGDEFTDVLPASLSLVSATASSGAAAANLGTNTVSWNGAIAAGGSVTITIDATIAASASGAIANQGQIAYDADGNGSNEASGVTDDPGTPGANDATVLVVGASADLSVSKTDGVATIAAGASSTYTIVVANAGPSAVTGASVSDVFPAACTTPSWTCAGSGGGSCPAGGSGDIAASVDLPVGASATFSATCTIGAGVAAGTVVSNTAQVAAPAGTTDPNPANNSASDTTTVSATPGGDTPTPVPGPGLPALLLLVCTIAFAGWRRAASMRR